MMSFKCSTIQLLLAILLALTSLISAFSYVMGQDLPYHEATTATITATVVTTTAPVYPREALLYHWVVKVPARDYVYIKFYAVKGSIIKIIAYIKPTDIDISIVRPDGSLELPESRYSGEFKYRFIATMSGTYMLKLSNVYSVLTSKTVDLAIVVDPPPHTITVVKTIVKTVTLQRVTTITTTKTTIISSTTTKILTTTVTSSTTIVKKVQVVDWRMVGVIAVILFVIGFLAAWFVKSRSGA